MRKLRYVSEEKTLIDVTDRTIHGRYLLLPSPRLKKIVLGALGRAQRLHGVRIIGFACLSNHYLCAAAHKNRLSSTLGRNRGCGVR
jgi:hypothetical protein